MKIAVIGGGSMGLAFVRSWLNKELYKPEDILVIEKLPERADQIRDELKVIVETEFSNIKHVNFIFLAVKPQDFILVAQEIKKYLKPDHILISIMAGLMIKKISQELNLHKRIIRVMPNLPILVSQGLSAYYYDAEIEHVGLNIIEQLIAAGGKTLKLHNEEMVNAVTATAASGPGYVFYILKYLMEISKEMGFSATESMDLIATTIKGSIELWLQDGRSAEDLCAAVTSKGGTTAAALNHFEENKLGKILIEGIKNSKKRAEELAR